MEIEPQHVVFRPEIEPVVRWIEETPRDRIIETAIDQLRHGLPYRDLFAGLFLAGIRNIKPRPVGFKFHAVMVMNSAHLLSQGAPVEDRLLPMFWALDNFKASQARDIEEGDWTLAKVDEAHLPGPSECRAAFERAMENWDEDAADAASAALCRNAGAAESMELFWRYAIRDHRNIGHKPIFAMQCWRTLQTIGWQHAEPVLRSLAFGLLDLQGDARREPAGPYSFNKDQAKSIRTDWTGGTPESAVTHALVETIRTASPEEISRSIVKSLNDGVAPDSVWDAIAISASELMLRAPGIVPLHAVTATNALHFIYLSSGTDESRRLALLQAGTWIPAYRTRVQSDVDRASSVHLDALEPIRPSATGDEAVEEILTEAGSDRTRAAQKALGYLEADGSPGLLLTAARRAIFRKGRDSHDYKYGAALCEEADLLTDPKLRPSLVASIMSKVPAANAADHPLIQRAIAAAGDKLG
jgi:hypothetical protein